MILRGGSARVAGHGRHRKALSRVDFAHSVKKDFAAPILRVHSVVRCQSSSRRDVRGAWRASLGRIRKGAAAHAVARSMPNSNAAGSGEGCPQLGSQLGPQLVGLDVIEQRINYRFQNRGLLTQALIHASVSNTRVESNERLEFLGDSILGAVVCEHLYVRFPEELEGGLTKIKSNAVSRRICADIAIELGCADAVRLGKGMGDRAALPVSLLAALFESIIGAIYLDAGMDPAREFILRCLSERIENSARLGHQQNFKSVLQQSLQRKELGAPSYQILHETGPDHAKTFEICVEVGARRFKACWALSKKSAEQMAALEALVELGLAERSDDGEVRLIEAA